MVLKHKTKTADAVAREMFPWITSCAGWDAGQPTGPVVLLEGATRKIIVHHTGEQGHNTTDLSPARAVKLAKEIQHDHQGRGFVDSGQHFTISRGGHVLEGRHRSLETLETGQAQVVSAHCPGRNMDSIGIENEGKYITELPTPQLWKSLVKLCATICRQYNLKAHNIFGHWDFRSTQCPGIAFYRQFPRLRQEVAAELATPIGEVPERTWPDIYNSVDGPVVTLAQYLLRNAEYDLDPTGVWCSSTSRAVQDWQVSHSLAVSAAATMTAVTWETLAPELDGHATGEAVRGVQSILIPRGYTAVAINGQFDNATKDAVKDLQKLHGLPANGKVDTRTWCAISGGVIRDAFKSSR